MKVYRIILSGLVMMFLAFNIHAVNTEPILKSTSKHGVGRAAKNLLVNKEASL
jgi:hypothetical protein